MVGVIGGIADVIGGIAGVIGGIVIACTSVARWLGKVFD
jgi:hypothetical protein